jgi:hypothetical protein
MQEILNRPIVLTATIYPRAIRTTHLDPHKRRLEYIKAVMYYSKITKVYFLENSGYDFSVDSDFTSIENVIYIPCEPSREFSKGKGYQEFEMIDRWFELYGAKYSGFLKITGRYIIKNIVDIINDVGKIDSSDAIFERKINNEKLAHTDLFYSGSLFYKNFLIGCYKHTNDSSGIFIEHIVGAIIESKSNVRLFSSHPIKSGISGSTGINFKNNILRRIVFRLRNFLYFFNNRLRLI